MQVTLREEGKPGRGKDGGKVRGADHVGSANVEGKQDEDETELNEMIQLLWKVL